MVVNAYVLPQPERGMYGGKCMAKMYGDVWEASIIISRRFGSARAQLHRSLRPESAVISTSEWVKVGASVV